MFEVWGAYVDLVAAVANTEVLEDGLLAHGVEVDHVLYALRLISRRDVLHLRFQICVVISRLAQSSAPGLRS